jgi:hypothetical protein
MASFPRDDKKRFGKHRLYPTIEVANGYFPEILGFFADIKNLKSLIHHAFPCHHLP